jgi:hypothetical protein
MSDDASTATLREVFTRALREAYLSGRGAPATMEPSVRAYARALRLDGIAVEKMIIDVKGIVRGETGHHELVFIPPIVGWAVAGYFAGISPKDDIGRR